MATASSSGLNDFARAKAEELSKNWKGTSATGGTTKNFIGGEFVESKAEKWIEVHDPVRPDLIQVLLAWLTCLISQATQTLLTRVPETTSEEFDQAVSAADQAYQSWRRTSVVTRQRAVLECVSTFVPQVTLSNAASDCNIWSEATQMR